MKCSIPRRAIVLGLLLASATIAGHVSAFELDESILGVVNPPYMIGDVLSDEQLSTFPCAEGDNGLLVCPIRKYGEHMFGVMIDPSGSANRVTTVMVFWACKPDTCDRSVQETVSSYTKTLGERPGELDGYPIWKDREVSRRDLTVTKVGENMIAVMLIESDP